MEVLIREVFGMALRYLLGYKSATYVDEKEVQDYIISKLYEFGFDINDVALIINKINQELTSDLIYNSDNHRYYFQNEYDAENKIRGYLVTQKGKRTNRDVTRHIKSAEKAGHIKYSAEQKAAITSVFQHVFSVITGGPGTGKTTIIQGIYEVAIKLGYHVRIFAPTGKAAMRIQQATELFASTIHKGLTEEITSHGKNLIIIDEASMIDSYLMGLIIEHWGMFTIVLMGDVNQLPSVGNGDVLYDIIHSGMVEVTYLSEGYRSGETIVSNANMSLQNMYVKDWKYDASFRFIPIKFKFSDEELGLNEKQISRFIEVVCNFWEHLTKQYDIKDIIILLPLKREDIEKDKFITSDTINVYIQSKRFCRVEEEYLYYIGDRVIYTQNRYDLSDEKGNNLYNGMTGTVVSHKEDGFIFVQFDNGSEFTLHEDDENLELAYALTVHKAQGSEYKAVIFIAINNNVANSNLCY
ncbi:MAG: ATP-dependent DNA helicase, partial [Mobilitalea sp.]